METGVPTDDASQISWSRALRRKLASGVELEVNNSSVRSASYRPFNRANVYFDPQLIEVQSKMRTIYPSKATHNLGFYVVGAGSDKPFSVLMTDSILDIAFWGSSSGNYFARHTFQEGSSQESDLLSELNIESGDQPIDNISEDALRDFRESYGPNVSKDDVFFYVYGLLHSPEYRTRFEADLGKMLPLIPKVAGIDGFRAFVDAGKDLSDLHIGYESLEPYALDEVATAMSVDQDDYARYSVTKMKYGGKAPAWDKTRIIYNAQITLAGIPEDAHRYMLGSRSAVDWIIERYQVKTDKASGIVNDPNDWSREQGQPRYIIDLIGRIVTLSLETNRIVDGLPGLGLD
ncbi:hypothetical protein ASG92_12865 [Arthrobacter sp. Soil736]|nr:hypothetical protein ASG92_12865 [Arthrobacter sp. Soil736]